MRLECDVCGLAACDLPDMVDPNMFFERDDGVTHCPTCPASDGITVECWPGMDR